MPRGERWGKPANLFWMWAGAVWNVEFVVYGALTIVVFGLSFAQAVLVILVGNVFYLLTGLASLQGPQAGTTTFAISRAPFGPLGNKLPSLFNWITQVGFETEGIALIVFAGILLTAKAGYTAGTPAKVIFIVVAIAIQAVLPLLGHVAVLKVLRLPAIPFVALFVIMAILTASQVSLHAAPHGASWGAVLIAMALIISAGGLGWTENGNDYSRYLSPSASKRRIVAAVALGGAIPSVLLEVPQEDQQQFHAWTEDIVAGLDADEQDSGDELLKRRDQAQAAMIGFVSDLIDRHRKQPDSSMLSGMANDGSPDAMTVAELISTSFLLLVAGHERTVNLTANGVLTLLRNPRAMGRLRDDPGWVVPLVEELLRFEPPVQYLPNRTTLTEIELDGTTIPKGAQVMLVLAAANRDGSRISRPEEFDPDRIRNGDAPHVGFGSGLHYCFGAPLARIEAQVSLLAFARRFVNPRLMADPPPYRPSPVLRGPVHLPVRYDRLLPGG